MKTLIFIDACMRAGSRTRRIARPIIAELGKRYSVESVDLTKNIYPVADNYTLEDRNQGVVPEEHVDLGKRSGTDIVGYNIREDISSSWRQKGQPPISLISRNLWTLL